MPSKNTTPSSGPVTQKVKTPRKKVRKVWKYTQPMFRRPDEPDIPHEVSARFDGVYSTNVHRPEREHWIDETGRSGELDHDGPFFSTRDRAYIHAINKALDRSAALMREVTHLTNKWHEEEGTRYLAGQVTDELLRTDR